MVSQLISAPFCILVSECSPFCSLSRCALFLFLFGLFSLLLPGWYNAVVWVLRSPWSIGSSENTLKGHFIMFMKQHLRPSSNMTLWESSILNSLQTFVTPFALKWHFFLSFGCQHFNSNANLSRLPFYLFSVFLMYRNVLLLLLSSDRPRRVEQPWDLIIKTRPTLPLLLTALLGLFSLTFCSIVGSFTVKVGPWGRREHSQYRHKEDIRKK